MDAFHASLEERLLICTYDRAACLAALRGEEVPHALGLPLNQLCIIRGMRFHFGFGEELRGFRPEYTRAWNARNIMSNVIPDDFASPEDVPYCIWHPDVASEVTYRKLFQMYPSMAYQIGRACAVAGYTKLYNELGLLPDVHIAEEARECGNLAIHDAIVSQPVRHSIMNDYERRVAPGNLKPAYLNGDTCVHWMLNIRQEFTKPSTTYHIIDGRCLSFDLFGNEGFNRHDPFDLTEDKGIDEFESSDDDKRLSVSRLEVQLLHEPLPLDLPTVQKDLLISMAAYHGNVDRYVRLRRPKSVYPEKLCCLRGIYHNTFFAVWWSKQPQSEQIYGMASAINARFIMENVLSKAPYPLSETPYLIWWPKTAQESTYRYLADVHPIMTPQILRACVYAGYRTLFDELLPSYTPDEMLVEEAKRQGNTYFRQALAERLTTLGLDKALSLSGVAGDYGVFAYTHDSSGPIHVYDYVDAQGIVGSSFYSPYDGRQCDADAVEFLVCVPEMWRQSPGDYFPELDYVNWPPGVRLQQFCNQQ